MEQKTKAKRPLSRYYKFAEYRNYHWDHEKRLHDAEVAQFGIEDGEYHSDGVHRQQFDPFGRR